MKNLALLLVVATSFTTQALAFGIESNVSINVGATGNGAQEAPAQNGSGPVGLGLGIARDAVGAGLSIARGATEGSLQTAEAVTQASLQTAGSIINTLNHSDRRALRSYCAQRPLTRRQQAQFDRLPNNWQQDVRRSQPLPEEIEDHAIVISAKHAGIRNRNSAAVVLRVENKLILVDSRTDIVVDIMAL